MPMGWNPEVSTTPPMIVLDALDMKTIINQDFQNDKDKNQPWRYGIVREVPLRISDGLWTDLPDGGKIWQLIIHSPQAVNLSVNFSAIELPVGSRLQLYNDQRTDVTNSYTGLEHYADGRLGTWFVEGETIWIEYYQPAKVSGMPILEIENIIHGYRMGLVTSYYSDLLENPESGDCHFDVNCSIGGDFDAEKDLLKKSVALLNLGNGYLCSATLINNAESDKTPYLLTANHCLENSDPSLWSARFNWISPDPVCGTGEESSDSKTNYTISGASLNAHNALTDFALVSLTNAIPSSWDVVFAGWDRSDADPLFEVGIHHPNGDIMKVCRDDSGAQKMSAFGTEVWLIGGGEYGWGNGWEIGTTEDGSSGSPLFNENGKLIGQLYAGDASCDGEGGNYEYDMYGRFGVSWEAGNTEETRLKDWLDPEDTGVTEIETLQNILNVPGFEQTGELKVFPNPTSNTVTILNNRFPKLSFVLYNLVGQELLEGDVSDTMNSLSLGHLSEGVYMLRLIDGETQDALTKKIVIKR